MFTTNSGYRCPTFKHFSVDGFKFFFFFFFFYFWKQNKDWSIRKKNEKTKVQVINEWTFINYTNDAVFFFFFKSITRFKSILIYKIKNFFPSLRKNFWWSLKWVVIFQCEWNIQFKSWMFKEQKKKKKEGKRWRNERQKDGERKKNNLYLKVKSS